MPRIQQLSPSVVTRIAAGEVIERPASVLKELLENSIDAGSSRIEIDVEAGGTELIRVVDNGCGIEPEDLPLAFASHATSKLRDADDLFRICTMGFRGEALASIGGVAQVTLQSRPAANGNCQATEICGSEITCHGGELSEVRPWNGAPGTRIEVRNLFFNTPVRRKFLKTAATEMGHLCEAFTRLALAHPGLHLVLRHNGRAVYEVPGTANLRQRICLFFGSEVEEKLYPIEAEAGAGRLTGFIADPSVERGNAKMQYLYVNRRWIRDRSLSHALQEAYRGLLMVGRYAVAFLFVELPPNQVDVNVHPTKCEVRFRDGHTLYNLVHSSIRRRLSAENLVPKLQVGSTPTRGQGDKKTGRQGDKESEVGSVSLSPCLPVSLSPYSAAAPERPLSVADLQAAFEQAAPLTPPSPRAAAAKVAVPPWEVTAISAALPAPGNELPDLKAIQLYNAYLVVETPEGLLVIDQHALHERILFEQFKRRMREGSLETQRLLIPDTVELTREQAALALEYREALAELGLLIEDFGGGTLLLQGYPSLLGQRDPQELLKSVIEHLCAKDRLPTREVLFHDLLSLMACHSAVRAGDPLTPEQIATLLAQRQLAEDTHHCPHGRPTQLLLTRRDLDRQFGRI